MRSQLTRPEAKGDSTGSALLDVGLDAGIHGVPRVLPPTGSVWNLVLSARLQTVQNWRILQVVEDEEAGVELHHRKSGGRDSHVVDYYLCVLELLAPPADKGGASLKIWNCSSRVWREGAGPRP